MTLQEMSEEYRACAAELSAVLRTLRAELRTCRDPEERFRLQQRIYVLTTVLTQTNELAELTERYYERGYWRSEKYTL